MGRNLYRLKSIWKLINMDPVQLFKALADQTRLRCLLLLARHEELCVCELTHALGLSQPKISHHLASLRKGVLVTDRKLGLWTYYRLNPDLPAWALEVIKGTHGGVMDVAPFVDDTRSLLEMPDRPGGICGG